MQSTNLKAEITRLTELLRRASLEAENHAVAERVQAILIGEIHHRTQNMLAMVTAIVRQSMRAADSLQDAEAAITARLVAMAKAHALLLRTDWMATGIRDVLREAVTQHDTVDGRIHLAGENMLVSSTVILPLTLALNELCTNAIKHGALGASMGRVSITWKADEKDFMLRWAESGGPPVTAPLRNSFGMRLIEQALPRQLGGVGRVSFPSSGMIFELTLPLARLVPAVPAMMEEPAHV